MPDADRVKQNMHRLKGAAANLSLVRLADAAKRAEAQAVACSAEQYAATLVHLAEEVEIVAGFLEQRALREEPVEAGERPLAANDLAALIDRAAATFRSFEIDEDVLQELRAACPRDRFEPLQRAIDSFDFEAALSALEPLRQS
jgi:HPt (histidine-containing phosphotransfer) domain-containing protein